MRYLWVFIFLFMAQNAYATDYISFNAFPITPTSSEISGTSAWTHSYTSDDLDMFTATSTIGTYYNTFYRYSVSDNTSHIGYRNYGYLEVSDDKYQDGDRSLKYTVTGGVNGEYPEPGDGEVVNNKGDYLDFINTSIDPVSGEKIGTPYIYFSTTESVNPYDAIPETAGNDRLEFYIWLPDDVTIGNGGYEVAPSNTIDVGPFEGSASSHWYHKSYINGGGWIKLSIDNHPAHNNAWNQNSDTPYPSWSMRDLGSAEYLQEIYRWYITFYPYAGLATTPYSIYVDNIKFVTTSSETQNNETINSISILFKDTGDWEMSFSDKYRDNQYSFATYQIKYSTSPITNANWDSATDALIQEDTDFGIQSRADGKFDKNTPYYMNVWAPFRLSTTDTSNLSAGDTIYFAVKDIGNLDTNGDATQTPNDSLTGASGKGGRDYVNHGSTFDYAGDSAAIEYVKLIDYQIPADYGAYSPPESGSPLGGNSRLNNIGTGNSSINFN